MNIIHIVFGAKFLTVAKVLCRKLNDLKKMSPKFPKGIAIYLQMVQVGSQKYRTLFKFFSLSYFVDSQIFLNRFMDDDHLR